MPDIKTLMRRSAGQEQLKKEWNELKANKQDARDAYRAAKREVPQDIVKVRNAKAALVDADDALKAQRKKNRMFNKQETARVIGEGQTKQDTLDNPTDPNASVAENTANTSMPGDEPGMTKGQRFLKGVASFAKGVNDLGQNTRQETGRLSQSFYDAIAGAIAGTNRNAFDEAAKTAKEQAQNQRNESARREMEAQSSQQIANRNEYTEAGKIASMQNDAENRQAINNTSFAAGNAAARMRKTNAPDVQSQQARQDQQRNIANQRREEADIAQQGATESYGQSETFNTRSAQFNRDRAQAANLSAPPQQAQQQQAQQQEQTQQQDAQQQEQTQQQDAQQQEQDAQQQEQTQQQDAQQQEQDAQQPQGQPQNAAGSESDAYERIKQGKATDKDLAMFSKYTEEQLVEMGFGPKSIDAILSNEVQEGQKAQETQDSLNKIRERDLPSDSSIKDVHKPYSKEDELLTCLSDIRCKNIKESLEAGNEMSPEDFLWLARHTGGKYNVDGREYDFFNDDDWDDDEDGSVLDGYGEFIRNYVYTYKPEAVEIDSRIDPNETHIGPMAQDIEKVNPACIKETPEGVKTVDTQRLSMMNAGAIGDLVRELDELKAKLIKLGV